MPLIVIKLGIHNQKNINYKIINNENNLNVGNQLWRDR